MFLLSSYVTNLQTVGPNSWTNIKSPPSISDILVECSDESFLNFPQYSHRIPSIASCWINLMFDSLTSAPVVSMKESPLFFFSITTSSGNPKPGVNKKMSVHSSCVNKSGKTQLILAVILNLFISLISNGVFHCWCVAQHLPAQNRKLNLESTSLTTVSLSAHK